MKKGILFMRAVLPAGLFAQEKNVIHHLNYCV